ncbi:helix-turn-helix domain-containing protein [Methylorubrum thiocyanatum]|uniref:helix-turn-helix domain-containing protein n=1 Tax=Methylorubrum thiocyanatum TaxID=47958 RepID=UPI00398C7AB0
MRERPGHPTLFDHWDRIAARVAATRQAIEHEKKHGQGNRKHKGKRAAWSIDRQRLAEVQKVIHHRHGGACDTDDGPTYLRAAMPHLLRLYGGGDEGHDKICGWAAVWLPTMAQGDVSAAVEKAFRDDPPPLKADTLAGLLNMHRDERTALSLRTIGAVDQTSRERADERRRKDAAYRTEKRRQEGATPREQSAEQREPWKALGMSRRTYYRKLAAGTLPEAEKPVGTDPSAIVRSTYNSRQSSATASGLSVPGPAIKASPRQAVGADGPSPGARTRAVPAGHAVPLPLPQEGFQEHPDFFGSDDAWISLGSALDYAGGLMPPEVARAVRAAQRARSMTQEAVARHIGISRPQLANALRGRFGLSRSAASNLCAWLAAA